MSWTVWISNYPRLQQILCLGLLSEWRQKNRLVVNYVESGQAFVYIVSGGAFMKFQIDSVWPYYLALCFPFWFLFLQNQEKNKNYIIISFFFCLRIFFVGSKHKSNII